MMSDRERASVDLGMRILDEALMALGESPTQNSPFFRAAEPLIGVFPNLYLEKPDVAPFRFVFSTTLDVWVGPFSEVFLVDVLKTSPDALREAIERILRSGVSVDTGWRVTTTTITLTEPAARPWLRLRVRARGVPHGLASYYEPFHPPMTGRIVEADYEYPI